MRSRHLDLGVHGKPSATILESVPKYDVDRVLVIRKQEAVCGRVGWIWMTKVSRVSSGAQGVASLPQQHQVYRGVWLMSRVREQDSTVWMRDIDRLELGMRAIVHDGVRRQKEKIRETQYIALL